MEDILDDIQDDNENNEVNDWRNYLGEQADYYIPIWEKIQSGQKVIFNIYAFLFGIFWMLYQKMYRISIIIGIILTIQIIVKELLRINWGMTGNEFSPISWSINLIAWITFGLFGNYFFYHDAQQKITASKKLIPEYYDSQLQEIGGTSILSIVVGIVIYITILVFIMVIFNM